MKNEIQYELKDRYGRCHGIANESGLKRAIALHVELTGQIPLVRTILQKEDLGLSRFDITLPEPKKFPQRDPYQVNLLPPRKPYDPFDKPPFPRDPYDPLPRRSQLNDDLFNERRSY